MAARSLALGEPLLRKAEWRCEMCGWKLRRLSLFIGFCVAGVPCCLHWSGSRGAEVHELIATRANKLTVPTVKRPLQPSTLAAKRLPSFVVAASRGRDEPDEYLKEPPRAGSKGSQGESEWESLLREAQEQSLIVKLAKSLFGGDKAPETPTTTLAPGPQLLYQQLLQQKKEAEERLNISPFVRKGKGRGRGGIIPTQAGVRKPYEPFKKPYRTNEQLWKETKQEAEDMAKQEQYKKENPEKVELDYQVKKLWDESYAKAAKSQEEAKDK
eukprot:gnl/TRDRNA2_/TRDRNA2_130376_c0_seq1.p1 gnl/TRDRNA2_/TRDRNA2_130376_c0~~gnl/TRDRNA2_/TRDRNA2_130376_c0_seq1.p1  ORF type:complete len:270 (+),score=58.12 gnl/TRDRNA2_/TRDRNA2_130376_c0_seq1:126-935(+)